MSDVMSDCPCETVPRSSGPTIMPEETADLLGELEQLRQRVEGMTADGVRTDESRAAGRKLSGHLRCIAVQVIDLSVALIDEDLTAACDNAIRGLQVEITRLHGVQDEDDVWQEVYGRLRAVLRNLNSGNDPFEALNAYAFVTTQRYLVSVQKKMRRMRSLSALPGEENAILATPAREEAASGLVFDDIVQFLNRAQQGHGGPSWDEVFRVVVRNDYSLKAAAAELGIKLRKMRALWKAITSRLKPEFGPVRSGVTVSRQNRGRDRRDGGEECSAVAGLQPQPGPAPPDCDRSPGAD